jgi:hypothetical protein
MKRDFLTLEIYEIGKMDVNECRGRDRSYFIRKILRLRTILPLFSLTR